MFWFSLFSFFRLINFEEDLDEILLDESFFEGSKSLLSVLLWAKISLAIS